MSAPQASKKSVDDVIVAPEPVPYRQTRAEKEGLLALSHTFAREPASAVQRLVEVAMKLTGAGSSGVSLNDMEAGQPVFRWVATAGEFRRYLHGTMPRHFSPCGTTVERGRPLVMKDPSRCYPYIESLHAPVRAALLVPFAQKGTLVGTVWVAAHEKDAAFTEEDVRVVQGLTVFSSALLDTIRP
jgi:GAF domain-containing protein